jgi:hypothetical protein
MHMVAVAPTAYLANLTQADQTGGPVFFMGSNPGVLQATGLAQTRIALQTGGTAGLNLSKVASLTSIAPGGIGPVHLKDGSRALVSDVWYEGPDTLLYDIQGGEFTYLNGHMAPATHLGTTDFSQAAITIDGLQGKASFIAFSVNTSNIPSGVAVRVRNETAATQALIMGTSIASPTFLDRAGTVGQLGLVMNKGLSDANKPVLRADQGRADDDFVRTMMSQARSLVWESTPSTRPDGATDVHFYRIHAPQTLGVTITGN